VLKGLARWVMPLGVAATVRAVPEAVLAPGTRYETSLFVHEAAEPGPSVLVVGGIHGNEPAPPRAVSTLTEIELPRGRLLFVPEANRRALAASSRHTPGDRFLDLNRNFPIASRREPRGVLATALWSLLEQHRPDWVIDVHEGFDYRRRNQKSVGNSVTYVPYARVGACSARLARHLVNDINRTIEDESKHFMLLAPGPEGSFARSATEALGVPSLVLETTRVAQPLALRVGQHRRLLSVALDRIGLTSATPRAAVCPKAD
jgi:succinylglutamate desuccinylase